jgi:hypothetical protein
VPDQNPVPALEAERVRLFDRMASLGDFRRGSVQTVYRKCGKDTCSCSQNDHPGHGPMLIWTRSVNGKTVTRKIGSDAELEKLQREFENYRQFKEVSAELVVVNDQICQLKPVDQAGGEQGSAVGAQKGGSTRTSPSRSGKRPRPRS